MFIFWSSFCLYETRPGVLHSSNYIGWPLFMKYEEFSMQSWSATGRRKRASAQVRICSPGTGTITINQVDGQHYLQDKFANILKPFQLLNVEDKCDIFVRTQGGGLTGQSDAIRLGCARALCLMNAEYRSALKAEGFLTRNALKKERKKYGLKKARKAPQFSKR
jgi:small subunit ribosomal protein S9